MDLTQLLICLGDVEVVTSSMVELCDELLLVEDYKLDQIIMNRNHT